MKRIFLILFVFFLIGDVGWCGMGTGAPPGPRKCTDAEIAAGTSTTPCVPNPYGISQTYSGASAEVVDATIDAAGDADTTHTYSKDDIHDYLNQHDSDFDGLPDGLESTSDIVINSLSLGTAPYSSDGDIKFSKTGGFYFRNNGDTADILGMNIQTDYIAIGTGSEGIILGTNGNLVYTPDEGTDTFYVQIGNLRVGDGTPTNTLNGEDAYIEGFEEVDGLIYSDGGISVATTKHISVGLNQWDNGSDKIDGEQIADDTIDDDSIDWADVTFADFTEQTPWRVFYSNGDGDVTELALGADGTYLKSNGATSAPTFATPTGSGDVSKVGTPTNHQWGVWTGDGTIEGVSVTASKVACTDADGEPVACTNLTDAAIPTRDSLGIDTDDSVTFGSVSAGSVTISGTDVVSQSDCSTITEGVCIDSDDGQIYRWDGDSVEYVGDASASGDITGVTAGTGLSGGGDSGTVTLNLDPSTARAAIYVQLLSDCSGITAGFCMDTDNGYLYAYDGDSVEEIARPNQVESIADPDADRILFWDESAGTGGTYALLSPDGTTIEISGTTLQVISGVYLTIAALGTGVETALGNTAGGAGGVALYNDTPTRDSLGLDTDDSPQLAGLEIGAASDTTLARSAAGVATIEGRYVPTSAQARRVYVSDDCSAETGMSTGDLCFEY